MSKFDKFRLSTKGDRLFLDNKMIAKIVGGEEIEINLHQYLLAWFGANATNENIISIKNDDEKLGIIVDVYDNNGNDLIDTECMWFEDFEN